MTEVEEWKPVPGFQGYEASTEGRIRSVTRRVPVYHGERTVVGQIIKPKVKRDGYLSAFMTDDSGKVRCWTVHKIIMLTFVGERPKGMQILHLDDNRHNCALRNLRYGTAQENHDLKILHGRTARGEKVNTAKLTEKQVVAMRERRAAGETTLSLSREFGISTTAVSKICIGENWKYAGGPITPNQIPGRKQTK